MRVARKLLAVAAIGLGCAPVAWGQTINVPADHATIQAGIVAAVNGDVVSVAPGTYNEAIDFLDKAITVQSTAGAEVTTIDSGPSATAVTLGGSNALIAFRGFTVRGATQLANPLFVGGIDAFDSAGIIEHNILTGSRTCHAPAIRASGTVVIANNVIWGNSMACSGGGILAPVEIYNGATFRSNLVVNNNGYTGGGVGVSGGTVEGNIIAGNAASEGGGILSEGQGAIIRNNLVYRNTAGLGGGIFLNFGTPNTVVNNSVVDNTAPRGAGLATRVFAHAGASHTVRNNIIKGLTGSLIYCDPLYSTTLVPTFGSNDIVPTGGTVIGTGSSCTDPTGTSGNIAVDPNFVDAARGDFHLASTSPLLDAGVATDGPTADADGDARPADGGAGPAGAQWDIGFDEARAAGNSVETTIESGPSPTTGLANITPFAFSSPTAGATFECDVDMSGFAPCTSPVSLGDLGSSRIHSFRVRARNAGGQVDQTPAMRLVLVDPVPPDTILDRAPVRVSGSTWRVQFHSDDVAAVFQCSLDGAPFAGCSSPHEMTPTVGAHTIVIRAIDDVGNVDPSPLSVPFEVPPPDTFVTQPTPVFNSGRWSVTLTSDTAGVTFECSLDAAPFAACTTPFEVTVLPGTHAIAARARDGQGNVDTTPASVAWSTNCTRFGGQLSTILVGTVGDDGLCGFGGDDLLRGLEGNDSLFGGPGDDVLNGGPGVDSLNGGDGIDDVADFSDRTSPVRVRLGDGLPDGGVEDGSGDTIGGLVENIWGGQANDDLTGDFDDNAIDGGPGADVIQGGPGFDFADYSTATTPVTADLDGQPGDDGRASEGDSIGLDIESLLGGSAGDTLTGGAQDDLIAGGAGDDTLAGGAGADFIFGEDGNDRIIASDGVIDEVDCGPGIDTAYTDVGESTTGCETRIFGNPPPPTPLPSPPPTTTPPPVSPVHRVRLTGSTGNAKAGITLRLTCDSNQVGSCRVRLTAKATVVTKGKKRTFVVGRVTGNVAPGAASALRIPLNSQAATLFKTRARLTVKVESALQSRTGQFAAGPVRTVVVRRLTATPKLRAAAIRSLHRIAPHR